MQIFCLFFCPFYVPSFVFCSNQICKLYFLLNKYIKRNDRILGCFRINESYFRASYLYFVHKAPDKCTLKDEEWKSILTIQYLFYESKTNALFFAECIFLLAHFKIFNKDESTVNEIKPMLSILNERIDWNQLWLQKDSIWKLSNAFWNKFTTLPLDKWVIKKISWIFIKIVFGCVLEIITNIRWNVSICCCCFVQIWCDMNK